VIAAAPWPRPYVISARDSRSTGGRRNASAAAARAIVERSAWQDGRGRRRIVHFEPRQRIIDILQFSLDRSEVFDVAFLPVGEQRPLRSRSLAASRMGTPWDRSF
jgi:hypothetical protein